ncbi:MAG: RNA polymerase Rpb4 family protein [Methanobacterium paludis]|uniref:DNA-directed RNA polymerase subunit Rpo4 n=1 Tax=Methanobacterium paludis (strain DSM 25820 / JCM 18151 / SWAN1) TaxID=868131 RepID=F6D516_METPW|nr:RNA polymerase Rpb4 family protein [Methanobacterium paludis]AEG19295.1 RNA polymerase Rpb4 [Methanobacterium paludis]MCE7697446.1 RNA polymerase Rpb4 family protein [Methanobacterium paludis]
MIGKKVIETDPITVADVKTMLGGLSESYDLTYEQNLALDHATKFSKLEVESADKLVEELQEIVKKTQAIKIADVMPLDLADLRLIFAKERGSHKKEELEQVLEVVNKYRE